MKLALLDSIKRLLRGNASGLIAGIALHQRCVRLVVGKMQGASWHYVLHDEVEAGSEEQWTEIIEDLIVKHELRDANCCLILPPNRYQLLQIDKPNIPDEELALSLGWHIKDLVTVPQEELVADYFEVPVKVPMQGDKINVVITSRKVIAPLIEVFIKNKVELDGIVPEELVTRNVIGHQETASLLLSQQKNEETALQIVKKDQIYFARKLRGFNRIHEYSAAELSDGLTDSLSLEIQRSMDYFESQLKQAPIKNIQLALPSSHQQLIAEQISQHFPTEVMVMSVSNELVEMALEPPLSEQFYPALGGALEFIKGQEAHDGA